MKQHYELFKSLIKSKSKKDKKIIIDQMDIDAKKLLWSSITAHEIFDKKYFIEIDGSENDIDLYGGSYRFDNFFEILYNISEKNLERHMDIAPIVMWNEIFMPILNGKTFITKKAYNEIIDDKFFCPSLIDFKKTTKLPNEEFMAEPTFGEERIVVVDPHVKQVYYVDKKHNYGGRDELTDMLKPLCDYPSEVIYFIAMIGNKSFENTHNPIVSKKRHMALIDCFGNTELKNKLLSPEERYKTLLSMSSFLQERTSNIIYVMPKYKVSPHEFDNYVDEMISYNYRGVRINHNNIIYQWQHQHVDSFYISAIDGGHIICEKEINGKIVMARLYYAGLINPKPGQMIRVRHDGEDFIDGQWVIKRPSIDI